MIQCDVCCDRERKGEHPPRHGGGVLASPRRNFRLISSRQALSPASCLAFSLPMLQHTGLSTLLTKPFAFLPLSCAHAVASSKHAPTPPSVSALFLSLLHSLQPKLLYFIFFVKLFNCLFPPLRIRKLPGDRDRVCLVHSWIPNSWQVIFFNCAD